MTYRAAHDAFTTLEGIAAVEVCTLLFIFSLHCTAVFALLCMVWSGMSGMLSQPSLKLALTGQLITKRVTDFSLFFVYRVTDRVN